MTDDEIIDLRDALRSIVNLSVHEQNLYRDCNIALGVVRCEPEAREEARARLSHAMHQG